jgi:hypothetical protein
MGGLIHDLPRKEVFDRRGEIIDLEPLSSAAIDVVEHPFQRPQPDDLPQGLFSTEVPLLYTWITASMGVLWRSSRLLSMSS